MGGSSPHRQSSEKLAGMGCLVSLGVNFSTAVIMSVFGAVFCLLFAILNPAVQLHEINEPEIARQWRDGSIALRLSTLIFAASLIGTQFKYLRRVAKVKPARPDELALQIPAQLSDEERLCRDIFQSAVFALVLTILWVLRAQGVTTPATVVLSWAFLCFSDDWSIISSYSRALKGRILVSHQRRMYVANLLLVGPLLVVVWQEWGTLAVFVLGGIALSYMWYLRQFATRVAFPVG
ncbi:hypothetical protein [Streptomyces bluensis]|uniref:hypothetical protein n=1 Tax=Streptomyces bluensis TaxID=33897 RepID=UPI001671A314|nr:hypothetical protein [Streptomyces bluensis]GGZ69972.1 hypothetical protein GCM10010344_41190 [Streptomyces bluensis]